MLDDLDRHEGLPPDRVFLGGFSQGAMLACDTVLRSPRAFAGLLILSGSIIAQREWEERWPARKGLPVFQSHGTDDPYSRTTRRYNSRIPFSRTGSP